MIVASNIPSVFTCASDVISWAWPIFCPRGIYSEILDTFDTSFILLGIVLLTLFTVSPTT